GEGGRALRQPRLPRGRVSPMQTRVRTLSQRRLWTLSALAALADFLFGATYVYVMLSAGLSGGTIGTLLAVSVVVSTLLDAPRGAWGDRFGQRRVIVGGLVVWGVGMGLFSLATRPLGYAPALVLWSAGMVVYASAPMALFGSLTDPDQRDTRLKTAV